MSTARETFEALDDARTDCAEAFRSAMADLREGLSQGAGFVKEAMSAHYYWASSRKYTFSIEEEIYQDEGYEGDKRTTPSDLFLAGQIALWVVPIVPVAGILTGAISCTYLSVGIAAAMTLTCPIVPIILGALIIPFIGNSIQSLPKGFIKVVNLMLSDEYQLSYQSFWTVDPNNDQRHWLRRRVFGAPGYLVGAAVGLPVGIVLGICRLLKKLGELALSGVLYLGQKLYAGLSWLAGTVKDNALSLGYRAAWLSWNAWNYTNRFEAYETFDDRAEKSGCIGSIVGCVVGGVVGAAVLVLRGIGLFLKAIGAFALSGVLYLGQKLYAGLSWLAGTVKDNALSLGYRAAWLIWNAWNYTGEFSAYETFDERREKKGFLGSLIGCVLGGVVGAAVLVLRGIGLFLKAIGAFALSGVLYLGQKLYAGLSWLAGTVKDNALSLGYRAAWLIWNAWNYTGEFSAYETFDERREKKGFLGSLIGCVLGGVVGAAVLVLRGIGLFLKAIGEFALSGVLYLGQKLYAGLSWLAGTVKDNALSLGYRAAWLSWNAWNYTNRFEAYETFDDRAEKNGCIGSVVGCVVGGMIGAVVLVLRGIGLFLKAIGAFALSGVLYIGQKLYAGLSWLAGTVKDNALSLGYRAAWLIWNAWNYTNRFEAYEAFDKRTEKKGFLGSLIGCVLGGVVGTAVLVLRGIGLFLKAIGEFALSGVLYLGQKLYAGLSWLAGTVKDNALSLGYRTAWLTWNAWNYTNRFEAYETFDDRAEKSGCIGSIVGCVVGGVVGAAVLVLRGIGLFLKAIGAFALSGVLYLGQKLYAGLSWLAGTVKDNALSLGYRTAWLSWNAWNYTGEFSAYETFDERAEKKGFLGGLVGCVLGGVVGAVVLVLRGIGLFLKAISEFALSGVLYLGQKLYAGLSWLAGTVKDNALSLGYRTAWLSWNAWNYTNRFEAYEAFDKRTEKKGFLGSLIGCVLGGVVGTAVLVLRGIGLFLKAIGEFALSGVLYLGQKLYAGLSWLAGTVKDNALSLGYRTAWLSWNAWNYTNRFEAYEAFDKRTEKKGFLGSLIGCVLGGVVGAVVLVLRGIGLFLKRICEFALNGVLYLSKKILGLCGLVADGFKHNFLSFAYTTKWLISNTCNYVGGNYTIYGAFDKRNSKQIQAGFIGRLAGLVLGGGIGAIICVGRGLKSFVNNTWKSFARSAGACINLAVSRYWFDGFDKDNRSPLENGIGGLGYIAGFVLGGCAILARIAIESAALITTAAVSLCLVTPFKIIAKIWRSAWSCCSCMPNIAKHFADRFAFDDPQSIYIQRLKELTSALNFKGRFTPSEYIQDSPSGKKSFGLSLFKCIKLNTSTFEEKIIDMALRAYQKHLASRENLNEDDILAAKAWLKQKVEVLKGKQAPGFFATGDEVQNKRTMIQKIYEFIDGAVFGDLNKEVRPRVPHNLHIITQTPHGAFFHGRPVNHMRTPDEKYAQEEGEEQIEPGSRPPSENPNFSRPVV